MKGYASHAGSGIGSVCGSNSFRAQVNCSDCSRCRERINAMIALVERAANGEDVRDAAIKLAKRLRLVGKEDMTTSAS